MLKNDFDRFKLRGDMPNTPVLKNVNLAVYLSGYTDGEGSFCISFSPRSKLKAKVEIRPSFSVSQNSDRAEVLYLFKEYFSCGFIRPDRSDKTYKFEVRSIKDIITKIIPHFKKFPLLSSKQKDFELFANICEQIVKKDFKIKNVIPLAYKMNTSGKRKYTADDLYSLL